MEKLLAAKPESYTQIINRSLLLYQKSFKHIYLLAITLTIIAFLPRFFSIVIGEDIFFTLHLFDLNRLWLFIINLISIVLFLSMLWRIHGVIDHLHEPLKEDLVIGVKKLFYVFIAAVIQSIIIFALIAIVFGMQIVMHQYLGAYLGITEMFVFSVTMIAQFFLLLYVYTLFIFLPPLIAIENKGIFSALRRSISLVWNHWWRTFSVQITPWLFYLFAIFLINLLFQINISIVFIARQSHSIWTTLIHMILFSFFIPWVATVLIVQLKDLELRKESHKKNVHKK